MKKIIYSIIAILALSIFVQSCDLDRQPLTDLSDETFWNNESNAELALTAMYRGGMVLKDREFHDWWSTCGIIFFDDLSDNGYDRRGAKNNYSKITNGNLTADNVYILNAWKGAYDRITKCNRFLEGVQNYPDGAKKTRYIAEARFLRACMYHYLACYFHDVPLITTVLTGDQANSVTKTSQSEILNFVVTELDAAAKDLPLVSELTSSEVGRAIKEAALAFEGRTLMFMKEWDKAATVYKTIIDLKDCALADDYKSLFVTSTVGSNKENLFVMQYLATYFGSWLPQFIYGGKDGGWSLLNPSGNLFEEYEFNDGTAFKYSDTRYNPDNLGEKRDSRLDYTIYYNGATFLGTKYVITPDGKYPEVIDYAHETSKTGFLWRKYSDETNPPADITSATIAYPIIRYAEVLLSYAECLVESKGSISQSDFDLTINAIRARKSVNMPAVSVSGLSKDELISKIRHERRVELAGEGIRVWDIFRWGIADKTLVGAVWGAPYPKSTGYAKLTKTVDPTGNCRWYVDKRSFRTSQDYTWPIPQSEQDLNPNLK